MDINWRDEMKKLRDELEKMQIQHEKDDRGYWDNCYDANHARAYENVVEMIDDIFKQEKAEEECKEKQREQDEAKEREWERIENYYDPDDPDEPELDKED